MCMYLLCVYVCAQCQCRTPQRASDPLELGVQTTVSHRVSFGN